MRVRYRSVTASMRVTPANVGRRIVEYATRDQAQTAINTLSNQNLMGRLIYVREVSGPVIEVKSRLTTRCRIVRQSHAFKLLVAKAAVAAVVATKAMAAFAEVAVAMVADVVAITKATEEVVTAAVEEAWGWEAVVRSTSPTFVSSLLSRVHTH